MCLPPSANIAPVPGDIIRYKRNYYSHYAVYIGDGKVLHKDNTNLIRKHKSKICIENIDAVSGEQMIANDQYKKYDADRLPFEKTLELGMSQVGTVTTYNILFNNCEHFVTEIRYNRKISNQIDTVKRSALFFAIYVAFIFHLLR